MRLPASCPACTLPCSAPHPASKAAHLVQEVPAVGRQLGRKLGDARVLAPAALDLLQPHLHVRVAAIGVRVLAVLKREHAQQHHEQQHAARPHVGLGRVVALLALLAADELGALQGGAYTMNSESQVGSWPARMVGCMTVACRRAAVGNCTASCNLRAVQACGLLQSSIQHCLWAAPTAGPKPFVV